jgi:CRP/FNR family transcriptional regulator, cyclic AMP receptor protein
MARSSYLDQLKEVPLFASFNKRDLRRVARASDEVDIRPGYVIVEQDRSGHGFYLILEGTASVRRNNRKVATLGPGEYFGELALLDRGPRNATVVADDQMRLLVLGPREFGAVLDEIPGLARKMLTTMAQRLRECDNRSVSH